MASSEEKKQYEFKAEVKKLLNILVHSLYTNKEIFLRELVSNASDALDKIRFEAARGTELADGALPLEIKIQYDKDQNLISITDTGIGMTEDEVVTNIGTIAKSGSAEFLDRMADSKEELSSLIGQFGVGFYSVFMVAEEVILKTRSYLPDEKPVLWRSDGLGSYEMSFLEEEIPRGTTVEVHLRDEAKEYADNHRLEAIIKKHSNFITFPIYIGDERVNTVEALWREPKFSISQEQYNEFYKFLTLDSSDPADTLHISVDAPVQFNSLLFIPPKSMLDLGFSQEYQGLDLYAKRVLIQRGNKELIPEYLGFVRGVVDSEDLPLNISRETLQENIILNKISKNIVKQLLDHLRKVADEDQDKFHSFWKEHGKQFKLGYNDYMNREKYIELLRFNSSVSDDAKGLVSLGEYTERMVSEQKEIYYVFGTSREAIALNPHMEIFKSKGIEVLYLFEPIDEFAMDAIRVYKEFEIKSVEQTDPATLDKFESQEPEKQTEALSDEEEAEFEKFLGRIKDILGDRITEVKVSGRLSESACCLVNPEGGMTSSMQKILQIVSKDSSIPQKVFEINKDHALVRNLFTIFKKNPQDDYLSASVEQLYESALLLEGYLKDPHAMVGRIHKLLNQSSGWYVSIADKE